MHKNTHTYVIIQVEFINKNNVWKYLDQPVEKEDQHKERWNIQKSMKKKIQTKDVENKKW